MSIDLTLRTCRMSCFGVHDGAKLRLCSEDLADMFGARSPDDVIGQDVLTFIAPESRDESIAAVLSGAKGLYRSVGMKLHGATFPIQIGSMPIRFHGGEARIVSIRDLSPVALVVDDEAPVARMTSFLMQHLGYQVVTLTNARLALAEYEYGGASVIITDVKMPDLDGVTLVERIRRLDPEVPVIFVSGYAERTIPQDARTAFVNKPFRGSELERALAGLPERARAPLE